MADKTIAFKKTGLSESDYANSKYDHGGETRFGITKFTAWSYGYFGPMKDMPYEFAVKVFTIGYWNALNLDQVKDQNLANELFDMAVNQGTGTAGTIIQQAVNYLNRNQITFLDTIIDGKVGPKTLDLINSFNDRELEYLRKVLFILRGERYLKIANKSPDQEMNLRSWLRRMSIS